MNWASKYRLAEAKFENPIRDERLRTDIAREHDITKSLLHKWEEVFLGRGAALLRSTETQTQELHDTARV